ncbi:unnamed protein product [Cylindrotheca closterium]|uniref:Uncharacterized protein n=1 Tax=Cylindrotheca closterium TaxID=2856 RepID=A0AAD2CMN6_9STRA|nr:unnamed protein product [Cylindrotheca closterium]
MGRLSYGGGRGHVTHQKVKDNPISKVVKHLFSTKDVNNEKARLLFKDAEERLIDDVQASGIKSSEDMVKSIQDGKSINFDSSTPKLDAPVARETEMTQNKILYSAKLNENM